MDNFWRRVFGLIIHATVQLALFAFCLNEIKAGDSAEPREVEFVYPNPNAKTVFVAGTFNGWNTTANPMQRLADGLWQTRVGVKPGHHQYKFIADGKWIQDPSNPLSAPDLFGGENSVITVNPETNQDGLANRQTISRSIRRLFLARDFSALEKQADELRRGKTRLPEGRWELPILYEGLNGPVPGSADPAVWQNYFTTLDDWHRQFPNSITEPVVRAHALVDYAWQARGTGWTSEVHRKDWAPFKDRVGQARTCLEEAAKLPDRCPEWYAVMQAIALAQEWDRAHYEDLFHEAIKHEPTYYDYYFNKAYYLAPRWNGHPGEWERFAESAPDLYDKTEGLALYARIAWNIDFLFGNIFRESAVQWPKMRDGFRDIIRQWPASLWDKNNFAYFACMAGDHAVAADLFAQIRDALDYDVWHSRTQFDAAKRWARAGSKAPSVHPLSRLRGRSATRANAIALAPETKCYLAGYADGVLLRWQPASGKTPGILTKLGAPIASVAVAPDGKYIACAIEEKNGEPGSVSVLDGAGFEKGNIQGWTGSPHALAWSADSSTLVAVGGQSAKPGEARLWDANKRQVAILPWAAPKHLLITAALSPDGRVLMTNDDANVRVWDLRENKSIFRLEKDTPELVQGVAFSADGKLAAAVCSRDSWETEAPGLLIVWNTDKWTEQKRIPLDCGAQHVAFSPDGRLLAATRRDNSITVWTTRDWTVLTEFLPMAGYLTGFAFGPHDNTLAVSTYKDGLSLWQIATK